MCCCNRRQTSSISMDNVCYPKVSVSIEYSLNISVYCYYEDKAFMRIMSRSKYDGANLFNLTILWLVSSDVACGFISISPCISAPGIISVV